MYVWKKQYIQGLLLSAVSGIHWVVMECIPTDKGDYCTANLQLKQKFWSKLWSLYPRTELYRGTATDSPEKLGVGTHKRGENHRVERAIAPYPSKR